VRACPSGRTGGRVSPGVSAVAGLAVLLLPEPGTGIAADAL